MPEQHLAWSRLWALEQEKPLVRATNIGPSAMISANGHVLTQTTLGHPQLLHAEYADLQPHQGHTPYARWGHGWPLLLVGGLFS